MSDTATQQREITRVYPTTSVLEIAENYTPDSDWCAPFSGNMLAYYFREYDSWPVGVYLP